MLPVISEFERRNARRRDYFVRWFERNVTGGLDDIYRRLQGRRILLYLGATDLAGGPQLNALELAKLLHRYSAVVTIATLTGVLPDRVACEIRQHAHLVSTPLRKAWWGLRNLYAFVSWWLDAGLRSQDVVVCMGYGQFHALMALFARRGGLVIERDTGDGAVTLAKPGPLFYRFTRGVDAVLVLSEGIRQEVLRSWPVTGPVIVIPEIVPTPVPLRRSRQADDIRVAYLGRLAPGKRVDLLLRVWSRLRVREATLHIYGQGVQEGRLRRLSSTITPGRVHFHGSYDRGQLGAILSEVDLVVLPSTAEGLPTVLVEAILCGVPFVATDVGAVSELASCHPDLIVVPQDDEGALRRAIEEQLRRICEKRIDKEGIAERALERYGYERVVERWLRILAATPAEIRGWS